MLRPFLLVGVGGSGGKTLRAVRQHLILKLQQIGWEDGMPDAWQFLHVDSPTVQDGREFPAPFMDPDDYLSLVPTGVNYDAIYTSIVQKVPKNLQNDIEKPLPSNKEVTVPVQLGAGAYRAIGRTIAIASLDKVQNKVRASIAKMTDGRTVTQLQSLNGKLSGAEGAVGSPIVIVVSSIAGGSGAGMFLDVTEAIKSATNGLPWADTTFSILYAPDVFSEIQTEAIPPNALGAIVETMSGSWNNVPTESTSALYSAYGLRTGGRVEYRIGPAFNYVVGRKNKVVNFGSQSNVYNSVSASIAGWMCDDRIQDSMAAYAVANRAATAASVPDNTELKRPSLDTPPFSSLGFGRVSLGMERFLEYSAERLAKQTVQTLLRRHLEQDPELKEKTEDQWVKYFADTNWGRFLTDSGLNELTENNNQVIDELQPDMTEFQANFKNAVLTQVSQGMPPAGLKFDVLVQRLVQVFDLQVGANLEAVQTARYKKAKDWVSTMPDKLMKLASESSAQFGLPVTVELFRRLLEQSRQAAAELLEERARHLADSTSSAVQMLVSSALGPAATLNTIPMNHPTVDQAVLQLQTAFHWRSFAELKELANILLVDFNENFLSPLATKLAEAGSGLFESSNAAKLLDQRDNPYKEWPDFSTSSVQERLKAAPNEQLLIPTSSYSDEFMSLLDQTYNDATIDAKRMVIDEIATGKFNEDLKKVKDSQLWSIIDFEQMWIPNDRRFQLSSATGQNARFRFELDHMEYVPFAKKWLTLQGRAFRNYLDQTLATYLVSAGDQSEQAKRQKNFLEGFQAAIAASEPLVELNPNLLNLIHNPTAAQTTAIVSSIPVENSGPLFEAMKNILVNAGFWDANNSPNWFRGTSAATVSGIEIFTQTANPIQPIVMSSVMEPIAALWNKRNGTPTSRSSFMQWRRGRPLPEAIPAAPEVWQQMLKGWYVARLLGMVSEAKDPNTFAERGPEVKIWTEPGLGETSFPYPLHNVGIASSIVDYPGIILDSLCIALINCYSQNNIDPLKPYKRLRALGSSLTGEDELSLWIKKGMTSNGAPSISPDRAGTAQDTMAERREKCIAYLQGEKKKFEDKISKIDPVQQSVRNFPISWEIREHVVRAIDEIIAAAQQLEEEDEL